MKMLRDWSISLKLTVLFGIVFVGFSLVGLTYQRVLDVSHEAHERAEVFEDMGVDAETGYIRFQEARRDETDLALFRDETTIANNLRRTQDIQRMMAQIAAAAPESESAAIAHRIGREIQGYAELMSQFTNAWLELGLDHKSGLRGELRDAAHGVGDMLKEHPLAPLRISFLMMRRHERGYLLRVQDKYLERMTAEYEAFPPILAEVDLPQETKDKLTERVNLYYTRFFAFSDAFGRMKQIEAELRAKANAIQPMFDKLLAEVAAGELASGQQERAETRQITTIFVGVLAVTGVLTALMIGIIGFGLRRRLARLLQTVSRLSEGDLEARTGLTGADELARLGREFDRLLDERVATLARAEVENDEINQSVMALLQAVAELSRRDLTVRVPVTEDVTGPVADALNLLTSETAKVLMDVRGISHNVAHVANLVKEQSISVVATADKEQQEIDQTANKLGTATQSMVTIAKLSQACNAAAARAIKTTEAAQESVLSTVEGINATRSTIRETEKRIKRLGERSQEITGVVNLINTIAERTHILALNASMHAASAGEAGRGFAVVADEVQRLAENARQATSEIATLVKNIQVETSETVTTMNDAIRQVVEGTRLAEDAGTKMGETRTNTQELVTMVERIAKDSGSQARLSRDLRELAQGIREKMRETNDELARQGKATEGLVSYSAKLLEAVNVFRLPDATGSTGNSGSPSPAIPIEMAREGKLANG